MPNVAAEFRRQAMRCAAEAEASPRADQRERLLRMREAFLTLAENEDWLNGRTRSQASKADALLRLS
jgi:hypothetical protein